MKTVKATDLVNAVLLKKKVDEAVKTIINFELCPLYLHGRAYKYNKSKEFLESMGKDIKKYAYDKIEKAFDEYHTPIEGMGDNTPYDMDQAMLNQ